MFTNQIACFCLGAGNFLAIPSAKQPATRQKRIEETVAKAAENVRANHYRA